MFTYTYLHITNYRCYIIGWHHLSVMWQTFIISANFIMNLVCISLFKCTVYVDTCVYMNTPRASCQMFTSQPPSA